MGQQGRIPSGGLKGEAVSCLSSQPLEASHSLWIMALHTLTSAFVIMSPLSLILVSLL